jgi:signal transduction histidine kinase
MKVNFKEIIDGFNIKKEADELGVSVWQAPSFLFIVMGLIIIMAMNGIYVLSKNYDSPEILIASESLVVSVLFIIGNFIIKSIEEIARANRMKTEFISIASHQLKTPLSEINWEIELLLSKYHKGLDKKQSEIIKEIYNSAGKMVKMVNDLLDVARIEQGRLALNSEPFELSSAIKDVIESYLSVAKKNNTKINFKIGKKIPKVVGDKQKTKVIIENLLSNGIKYIEKNGKVEISIISDNDFVRVKIADNGIGIPKNQYDKMFQKFFRINSDAGNKTEGTGLGLYIAKNIVEQSGGKIWFTSKQGKGTIFYFTLPIFKKIKKDIPKKV